MFDLISKAKAAIAFILDVIIPRFITEEVALRYIGNGLDDDLGSYEIACSLSDVEPGDEFDAIAEVDAVQFLGFGMTYRTVNMRAFENPHRAVA